MYTVNKVIIKKSVTFYSEVQKYRCEVQHNPSKYKEFVYNWYKNVKEMVENENRPEVKKYVRMQEINLEQYDIAYV